MDLKSLLVQIGVNTTAMEAGFRKADGLIRANAEKFKKAGKTITVAGAAIVGSFGLMVKSAVDFNKEMAAISTLIPGQGERLQELKKNVQDLAMAYGVSTTDIAQGLYQVISAFGDTADTAKILEINVKAAAAGMATTTEAINLTSAVTKAYGDTSAEAIQKVSDLAFQTVKLGQTTFPELAQSIGRVTPLAKELNLSQEELFATFATLTGVTGGANQVTTQFAGVLGAMVKPTEGMTGAMAGLGKEIGLGKDATAKAIVEELGFKGTLEGLKRQTDGTTVGLGKLFESKEALVGLLPLLSSQSEIYDEKLKAMGDSAGITDEAFKEMSEGINKSGFNMERLKQMTIVLSQRLGDQLAPVLGSLALAVGKAVQGITAWIKENPLLASTLLKIVGTLGALAVVLGPILMMLPGISLAMASFNKMAIVMAAKAKILAVTNALLGTSFTTMLGPISLIIAAVAAVAAGAYLIYKNWEPIKEFFKSLWGKISGFFDTTIGKIVGILVPFIGISMLIIKNWEPIKEFFIGLWGAVKKIVSAAISTLAKLFLDFHPAGLIIKHWKPITEFFAGLWEAVSGVFVAAFEGIKKKLLDWSIAIVGILEKIPIVKKLAGPWKEALQSMRDDMDKTTAHISQAATEVTEQGMAMAQALVGVVRESGLLEKATGLLGGIVKGLGDAFKKTGTDAEEAAATIAAANEKITSLTKTMVDEIKKAMLSEYDYAKWALKEKLKDRVKAIKAETAGEKEKNSAIALVNKAYRSEQAALDKAHKTEEQNRQKDLTEKMTEAWTSYWASVKEKQQAYITAERAMTDSIKQLTLDKTQYALWALDEEKKARDKAIEDEFGSTQEAQELLLLSAQEYAAKKRQIIFDAADEIGEKERETAEAGAEARKQSLENTLADISMILGAIDGLFQMAFNNQMIRIDNEEKRRLDSIDATYDAQIAAADALLAAEEAKSKRLLELEGEKTDQILESVKTEYKEKKAWIEANVTDEGEKARLLGELEKKYEHKLQRLAKKRAKREEKLRIKRLLKEEEAAAALEELERLKNEAIRIASEDLEKKRSEARRTAARQEKAVALLSAIVNTAAAVAKALSTLNIPLAIAVGILGAVQIGLIASQPIPLAAGGLVTQPTHALIGEAGPELVIPLSRLQPALAGGLGGGFKQYNYFYGDIHEAGDLDEISRQLAEKTRRALERGTI